MFGEKITANIDMCFVHITIVFINLKKIVLQMHKVGFKIFDALEPSQGMLDVAKEKGLYRNYICEAIGKEQLNLPAGILAAQ